MEEEKAITRALAGLHDSNRRPSSRPSSRPCSPAPPSRIPKLFGSNYTRVKVRAAHR